MWKGDSRCVCLVPDELWDGAQMQVPKLLGKGVALENDLRQSHRPKPSGVPSPAPDFSLCFVRFGLVAVFYTDNSIPQSRAAAIITSQAVVALCFLINWLCSEECCRALGSYPRHVVSPSQSGRRTLAGQEVQPDVAAMVNTVGLLAPCLSILYC